MIVLENQLEIDYHDLCIFENYSFSELILNFVRGKFKYVFMVF